MPTTFRIFAHIVSVIFHPLAIIPYVFGFLVYSNPTLFGFTSERMEGVVVISVISTAAMFPILAISLMKALGLVQSFQLHSSKERIGPLISTGLFFLWLYVNVRSNDSIPPAFSFFVLGSTIAVFLALVVNSFTKISLHAIGAGGMLTGMAFILLSFSYGYTYVFIPFTAIAFHVSDRALLGILFILAGAIGTARLMLHAHRPDEVYGGYLVGILSQLVAIRIFF
jgi:hypothetical protein